LIELSPWVDDFVGQLFGIGDAVRALSARHNELAPLYECKRQFVQRQAATKVKPEALAGFDAGAATATRPLPTARARGRARAPSRGAPSPPTS
jgi:hypothetical protein